MSNQQRWQDKSGGRFSNLKSPRKSILRASESPARFNSPLYSQDQGLEERRVSFAPDANLRLFNQTDSPSTSAKFMSNMVTEELHFTDSIQDIFEENEPSLLHADIMDSPASRKASESPSDRRKRRPDLFGSPLAHPKSPNVKVTGVPPTLLNRVNQGDLTDYLPGLTGSTIKRKINIFDEDDDEDEEDSRLNSMDNTRDNYRFSTHTHIHKRIHTQENIDDNRIQSQEEEDMELTQNSTQDNTTRDYTHTYPHNRTDSHDKTIHSQQGEEEEEEDMEITQRNSQRSDMEITQEPRMENTQNSDMFITERSAFIDRHKRDIPVAHNFTQDFTDGDSMVITQEFTRDITTRVSPPRSPLISPIRSPLRTPERSPIKSTHSPLFGTPHKSSLGSPHVSLFGTPSESSQRSPFGTPLGAHVSPNIRTPQRAQSGTPQRNLTSQRTPIIGSPLRTETLQKTPLGTPRRTPLQSPQRSTPQRTPLQVIQRTPTRSSFLGSPAGSIQRRRISEFSPRSFYERSPFSERNESLHDVHDVDAYSPHFYDPKDDISIRQRKMTLSEYLSHAGITFPDDLPVEKDESNHGDENDVPDKQETTFESLPILPELYLYQEACDQLIVSIKNSDDIIDKIDREVSTTNPQLFVEFMDANVSSQMKISQQLRDIKKYSLLKSEREWISLWTEKLKEFPSVLKDYQAILDQYHDLQVIQAQKLEKIERYKQGLSVDLQNYRQREQDNRSIDHQKMSELKQEIEIQGSFYNELKNSVNSLNDRDQQLSEEDKALDDEIKQLNESLKEAELATEKTSNITVKDLVYAKNDYQEYSALFRWKLKRNDEQVLHVEIGRGIDILIDLEKLSHRSSDAVTWQIASSLADDLGPIVELLHGFDIIAQNRSDPKEILQDMEFYWSSVEIIKRQLDRATARSWTKLTTLEDPSDSLMAGFKYDICLFSFEEKLRIEISFEIKVKDVFNFPAIDFQTLSLKVRYGNVERDTMENLIVQEFTENGIIGLDQGLKNILAKASDLQRTNS
ncbi:hypothetical protein INT47_002201 [Mucor saturninus]|uniref:Spc7 kinetochore protein domain-containing protein n=1 Tax=Mucor saturninus TaxID=64648 RepID=A0A8H7R791_9FUNG|nr:hypothetical protein INT47_002201 [Mucor saturninus]